MNIYGKTYSVMINIWDWTKHGKQKMKWNTEHHERAINIQGGKHNN